MFNLNKFLRAVEVVDGGRAAKNYIRSRERLSNEDIAPVMFFLMGTPNRNKRDVVRTLLRSDICDSAMKRSMVHDVLVTGPGGDWLKKIVINTRAGIVHDALCTMTDDDRDKVRIGTLDDTVVTAVNAVFDDNHKMIDTSMTINSPGDVALFASNVGMADESLGSYVVSDRAAAFANSIYGRTKEVTAEEVSTKLNDVIGGLVVDTPSTVSPEVSAAPGRPMWDDVEDSDSGSDSDPDDDPDPTLSTARRVEVNEYKIKATATSIDELMNSLGNIDDDSDDDEPMAPVVPVNEDDDNATVAYSSMDYKSMAFGSL